MTSISDKTDAATWATTATDQEVIADFDKQGGRTPVAGGPTFAQTFRDRLEARNAELVEWQAKHLGMSRAADKFFGQFTDTFSQLSTALKEWDEAVGLLDGFVNDDPALVVSADRAFLAKINANLTPSPPKPAAGGTVTEAGIDDAFGTIMACARTGTFARVHEAVKIIKAALRAQQGTEDGGWQVIGWAALRQREPDETRTWQFAEYDESGVPPDDSGPWFPLLVLSGAPAGRDVLAERQRQISAEGWTPEHDDKHTDGELAAAAACYANPIQVRSGGVPSAWPWDRKWWKPRDRRSDLVRAGALILAEIERLDRLAAVRPKDGPAPGGTK